MQIVATMSSTYPQIRIDPLAKESDKYYLVSNYISERSSYHLGAIFTSSGSLVFSSNNPMGNEMAATVVRTARGQGIPVEHAFLYAPGGAPSPRLDVV